MEASRFKQLAVIAVPLFLLAGIAQAQTVTTLAELSSAINAAPATNVETVIPVGASFAVTSAILIPANKNVKLTGTAGGSCVLSRRTGFRGHLFVVENDGRLSLENLVLDGGRDGGLTKNLSLVRAIGAFNVGNGAVLQNNDGCVSNVNCPAFYTLTVSAGTGGTVSPAGISPYNAGTVTVTASANSIYKFVNWTAVSGSLPAGITATNPEITFNISNNVNIRANFYTHFNPNITYGEFTDLRDNKKYKTVTIGSRTWMAENLNYSGAEGNLGICYINSADNCAKYGRLYTWSTVMNGASSSSTNPSGRQGICPAGWHVPSDAEWTQLENAVGGSSTAGRKLKSQTGWNSCGPSGSTYVCEDAHGFSALPGGGVSGNGSNLGHVGEYGGWWSATENSASYAWRRGMDHRFEYVIRGDDVKGQWFSLRCVRN